MNIHSLFFSENYMVYIWCMSRVNWNHKGILIFLYTETI